MARSGSRVLLAVLVAASFGAGCDGENVDIDVVDDPTPGAVSTATPAGSTPVRTPTPARTATT